MTIDYEPLPEELDDDYRPPRQKRRPPKAFAVVRSPWSHQAIKVFDDEDPDEKIEEFVAQGKEWWLETHDPLEAQRIRSNFFERQRKVQKR